MKKNLKKMMRCALILALLCALLPSGGAKAYTAPVSTVRIGLYYGSKALSSANLQNYAGRGSGFEFGYYDTGRQFVSVGASTAEEKITMLIDRNMAYDSSTNSYVAAAAGSTVVVGCFHVRLDGMYGSFAEACAAAEAVSPGNGFARYVDGGFYAMIGSYVSSADAAAAVSALGQGTVDSGSSTTVAVVKTGTNKVLFEFDCGGRQHLAVVPGSDGSAAPETWFKSYRWRGGFQYARLSADALTIVNFVDIEDYIKGVIPYEMSASWPLEALKAQAICARTYIMANLNKHRSYGFDCCNTTDCQVYYGRGNANDNSDSAVDGTAGQYLMYGDELCITYYHACDGGWTENSENVWRDASPYLRAVEDVYETAIADSIPGYNWTRTYTGDQLANRLRTRGYACSSIVKFEILELTAAGNVYKIRLTDSDGKSYTFTKENCRTVVGAGSQRYYLEGASSGAGQQTGGTYVNSSTQTLPQALGESYAIGADGVSQGLPDTAYAISGTGTIGEVSAGAPVSGGGTAAVTGSTFVIKGTGSGHNVGMSQRGAYAMAKNFNKSCEEILTFYFQGTTIVRSA